MNKKLILPAEVKICATCSFWDGKRKVDHELGIVVVEESCVGECLVESKSCRGLNDEFEWRDDCLWEPLAPDVPESSEHSLEKQPTAVCPADAVKEPETTLACTFFPVCDAEIGLGTP
ncbi:hypothetical protein AGMMS50256_28300 [Betaproteobacteria bacterium]|nr:hypothetical protein AGMMS50256_28300 [Betaproteobacteria bacterium]